MSSNIDAGERARSRVVGAAGLTVLVLAVEAPRKAEVAATASSSASGDSALPNVLIESRLTNRATESLVPFVVGTAAAACTVVDFSTSMYTTSGFHASV
jgi:hypothetical protein